jgi:NitT/TauT family transport system substrate-binding protein
VKVLGFLLLFLPFILVGFLGCQNPQITQSSNLRIGVVETINALPFYVMRDQGFDKQFGLNITETTFQSGDLLINSIAEGSQDGSPCGGTVNIILAKQMNLIPEKIIAVSANAFADPEHPITGVVVADSISSWKDLTGQNIGVPSKTSMFAAALVGRLHQEGVINYNLIEISISNTGLAIAGGNIAAGAMAEPYLTQSLLRKDGKFLDWIIGGKPFDSIEYTTNIFSTSLVKNHPEIVKAYLRAQRRSCQWMEQNPEATRTIMARRLALTSEVVKQVRMMSWPVDMRNDPLSLESVQSLLIEIGAIKNPVSGNQLYDETLLNEVLSEKR